MGADNKIYKSVEHRVFNIVPEVGVEPTCLAAIDLKSIAATNYATRATRWIIGKKSLNNKISRYFLQHP